MAKTTQKSATSAKEASNTNTPVGVPITSKTRTYVMAERGTGFGDSIVEFLTEHAGLAFTEPQLAEHFERYRDGRPHQQAINGPMRKVWDAAQETGKQHPAVKSGHELRLVSVPNAKGRMQKAWAVVKLD